MDINSILALSGTLAAAAALVVATITYFQLKHSRFALGVDLILKLEASFGSPEMMSARSLAAKALQNNSNAVELEPVLDFFETVGTLVHRRAIDRELAWSSFSYWVLRYAALGRDRIQERRTVESDITYYQDFDSLVKCLTRVEIKKRHLALLPSFSRESLADFLEEEID